MQHCKADLHLQHLFHSFAAMPEGTQDELGSKTAGEMQLKAKGSGGRC